MRIKKYTATSLQEGKARILKELGDDAIILSSRIIKKSNQADGTKEIIEIVAAIDENLLPEPEESYIEQYRQSRDSNFNKNSYSTGEDSAMLDVSSQLFEEIANLKVMLYDMSDSLKFKNISTFGKHYGSIYKQLILQGMSEAYALKIVGKALSQTVGEPTYEEALSKIRELFADYFKTTKILEKKDKTQIIGFIGPTGSGKTTSLVKLAVVCKLAMSADVLIVSGDTHKIGGSEQLQIFSSIAAIQFRSVYRPSDFKQIIQEEKKRDFIFLDTTGVSQRNKTKLDEISNLLDVTDFDCLYLVQPANSDAMTFREVQSEFGKLKPQAMILTKLDETAQIGSVMELLNGSQHPVAYFTKGQQIPEDLETAETNIITDLLMSNLSENISSE